MKNFFKYFFSILLMLSCLVVFSMLAYKVLFLDDKTPASPVPEDGIEANANSRRNRKIRYLVLKTLSLPQLTPRTSATRFLSVTQGL